MKNTILKHCAGMSAFLILATQLIIPTYATESTNTASVSSSAGTSATCTDSTTSNTSSCVGANNTSTTTASSNSVDTTSIINTIISAVETGNSDSAVESAVENSVNTIIKTLDTTSDSSLASDIDKYEKSINDKITKLTEESKKNTKNRTRLLKEIQSLKDLLTKLRIKAIEKNKKIVDKIKKVVNNSVVYEIRWGNLDNKTKVCTKVSSKELTDSLDKNEIPEKCLEGITKVNYTGKIGVNVGTLKVQKNVLFEANDKVTVSSGSAIGFESVIASHWDGLIVEYVPTTTTTSTNTTSANDVKNNEIEITISLGDLSQTYKGSEILGRKKIGNGHFIEIKPLINVLPGLTQATQDRVIQHKLNIQDKLSDLREKLERLRLLNKGGAGADELDKLIDEIGNYNFDDTSATNVKAEIEKLLSELKDNVSATDVSDKAKILKDKITKTKLNASARKFTTKLIPFKDTDDDQWYTKYVSAVKDRGIVSGYKDAKGNELGEFRPGNNVTVAEILKIGLENAEKGKAVGKTPNLRAAVNHWAKEYVSKGEELGLDLVKGNANLDKPATRGDVIRMMLEALDIKPKSVSSTSFSDLSVNHKDAAYIQYAADLGIISGDSNATTFRPDAPINRAEVSKIAELVNEIIMGGSDSVSATPINLP